MGISASLFCSFRRSIKTRKTIFVPTCSADGRPEKPAQPEPNPIKMDCVLGPTAVLCFVIVLEASFFLLLLDA